MRVSLFLIPVLLAMLALSCASVPREADAEEALRHLIQQEPGIDVKAIQYEEETGTAVVQLRSTEGDGAERLSYRWYVRDGNRWVLAPYVGVKRPDVP